MDTLGATQGNIDQFLAPRFKKSLRSWSSSGALSRAKVGEKIINHSGDSWWPEEEEELLLRPLEPEKEAPLPQEDKDDREYSLPLLVGPPEDRTGVKELREFSSIPF